MKTSRALLLSGIACAAILGSSPAVADEQPELADDLDPELVNEDEEILVLADRLRGQVDAPQPPVLVLNEEDIAAYGVGSIADLVQELSPQTNSGRGRGGGFPVMLVNGMRISSFRELRSYPPEALRRVEVLPEEVALRYGYSADQRVINFILKDDFSSTESEREYGQPWAGGYWTSESELTYLRIDGSRRLNLNGEVTLSSALYDVERGIVEPESLIPTIASDPDPATQRTLRDKSWEYAFDGTYTIPVGDSGGSLAFNGSVEKSLSKGRDGYNVILLTDPDDNSERRVVNPDDVIRQKRETLTFSSGATLNHPLGAWQLTATMDGSIAHSKNFNDRRLDTSDLVAGALAGDFAIDGVLPVLPSADRDLAETTSRTFNSLATANGVLLWMPAGEVSATLRSGYSLTNFESMDTRNPGIETSLTRHSLSAGGNLGIPLTSRREGVLSGIGDISLNLNGGITDLSDFGTLYDYTVGMFWSPTESLSLQASYIYAEAAPSLTQLGSPTIVNENVAVYDFANNETVLIETTSGGNPLLARETRKDIRLSAQWDLPFLSDARLQVDYNVNRSYDIASGFPGILTPEIESAFSDRVTRDIDGTLLALDLRPVTFARQTSRRIRYGINMGFQLGGSREQEERPQQSGNGAAPAAAQGGGSAVGPNGPAAPGGFGGGQGGPPGGFGGGQGGGNFDPARFQALRERLCAGTGDVQLSEEEIAQLPPFIVNQVRNEAGEIDQAQLNALRDRFCSADAQIVGGPGQPGGNFDPARFDAIRQRICAAPEGELPDLTDLPEPMLQRLRGEDGEIDPERFAALRAQMCAGGDAAGQQPGPGGGGFFRFGGPPGGGPPGGGGAPGAGRGPGGGGGGPPIGAIIGRMTGGGGGGGRMFVNLFHTIELENELLIAEGLPVLDLLDGDALSGGGTVRHSAELEGGIFMNGKGMRFSGRYSGKSRIDGSGMPGSSNLYFGSLLTLDLRAFVDLDQQPKLVEKIPLLKGTRISFSVDNVFDARRKVVDDNGEVPLRYQPGLIDPVGRFFEIEFRKLF